MSRARILSTLLMSALLVLTLTACGGSAEQPSKPETEPDPAPVEETQETLADLCGPDYQSYITETITMQMGNRMDKDPETVYFPIQEDRPLSDYVSIDETTAFAVEEDGNILILLPAGTVTDEAHGEQSFRIPKP